MKDKHKLKLPQILISAATLLFGFLVGPIFDYITNQKFSADQKITVMLPVLGLFIIILCTFIIQRYSETATRSVAKLADRTGPRIEILTYDKDTTKASFKRIIDLINGAEEIQALDTAPWMGAVEPAQKDSIFSNYYKALNNYVQSGKRYVRIIQYKDDYSKVFKAEDIKNPDALDHFKKVIAMHRDMKSNVKLMGSKIFMPGVAFLLIDQRYLIWEMPVFNLNSNLEFGFDFLIDDPDQQKTVLKNLLLVYRHIEHEASPITSFV